MCAMGVLCLLAIFSQLSIATGLHFRPGNQNGLSQVTLMSTHPEMCFPLATRLIDQVVETPLTGSNSSTNRAAFSGHSSGKWLLSGYFHNKYTDPCRTFQNQVFRTIDGSCNTVDNRGQSLQPLARLLPPAYSDGVASPRTASVLSTSLPLPSARLVSRAVHPDIIAITDLTIFVMVWGQLMDHEMVSTPLPIEDTRGTIQCCGPDAGPPTGSEDSECFPILFPPDPDFRGTCMELIRSQPVRDTAGNIILPRENENLITSFIDASTVYGSTQDKLDRLRDPQKPHLLRTTPDKFPPDNGLDDCVKRSDRDICFLAGDDRVNEHPALTLLHTILLRYHNYLATELRSLSPRSSSEIIFQQARAIVGAVMQNILYCDWLQIILGDSIRREFDLDFHPYRRSRFNPKQDPRIFQGFSTAVFRFGHTLIPRSLPLSSTRRPLLRDIFFKPFEARENLDTLTEGLLRSSDNEDRSQPYDRFIVEEVTSHLFENQEGPRRAFDLVALNLQRGRDHAIPPYNAYRRALGLQPVTSFNDPVLGSAGPSLATVYDTVEDIELFSGGIAEPSHAGGLVGETFSRLIALQLRRLKFGDRFFFSHNRGWHGFTRTQVKLIRRIRLAHILCLTTAVQSAQPNVFKVPGPNNRLRNCEDYRRRHPSMWNFLGYPL